MLGAPRNLACASVAADERKRRLQRIHMPDGFAAFQQAHIKVGDSGHSDLSLLDEPYHFSPGILDWRPGLIGPMKLVEINALYTQPAQGRLALSPNRFRLEYTTRLCHGVRLIRNQSTFGENQRTLGGRQLAQQASDNFLGVAQSVDRGRINPIDTQLQCMPHGGNGCVVILRSPTVGPSAAAEGPSSKPDRGDCNPARAERTLW